MSSEQVETAFNDLVGWQADMRVAHRLSVLLDMVGALGPWPDDSAPTLVRKLWK